MAYSYVPTRLGDYANTASNYASLAFPSAWSSDVGLTSNAYGDPSTGQPYTAQDIINQGGGNPNSIINVPHGHDFLGDWGAYMMLAPVAGMLGSAAMAGSGAAGAAGTTTGAATSAAGTGAAMDTVPSLDAMLADPSVTGLNLSTLGGGGITTGNAAFDSSLGLGSGGLGLGGLGGIGSDISQIGSGLNSLGGGGGGSSGLGNIWSALGNIGSGSMSLLPGLLALNYARNTAGIDTSGLSGILGKLGGNQDAIVKAATDPLQQNIAAGYGDLLQSQAARGIRGSSFGDTDIANYLSTTGNSLANAGANAAQGSLALQGNLAGEIATLNNQSQLQKNALYGNAFDVLGRALNPAGYAGSINLGGPNGGFTQTGAANTTSGVGQLLSGLGSLGSTIYNLL